MHIDLERYLPSTPLFILLSSLFLSISYDLSLPLSPSLSLFVSLSLSILLLYLLPRALYRLCTPSPFPRFFRTITNLPPKRFRTPLRSPTSLSPTSNPLDRHPLPSKIRPWQNSCLCPCHAPTNRACRRRSLCPSSLPHPRTRLSNQE